MKTYDSKTPPTVLTALEKHNNFQECIIKDIRFEDYCTNISIMIQYIWDDEFNVRPDIQSEELKIKFYLVQEFHIRNDLSQHMMTNIEQINWGFNEVSFVSLENNSSFLDRYKHLDQELHHVSFLWEDEKRFDIVFSSMEIT